MKKISTFCLCIIILSACVMDEELSQANVENESTSIQVYDIPHQETRAIPSNEYAQISLSLQNQTSNLSLKVKNIRICNIHQSGTYYFPSAYSLGYWLPSPEKTSLLLDSRPLELSPKDSLSRFTENGIPFIPQSINAWNPMTHPQNSTGCYLLMDCQILQGDENIVIWGNSDREYEEVAIPLNVCFKKGEKHQIEIVLDHNCPWYDIRDSVPSPVLQPICFDVTVEDWEEE